MTITGTKHNDHLNGTAHDDIFSLKQGGNDIVKGLNGDDDFLFGAKFTAADHIDGGKGVDRVFLAGAYSSLVTFTANTLKHVEELNLGAAHVYNLKTDNANVLAGKTLTINASELQGRNHLTFDGSGETNGHFSIFAGFGNDVLTGGHQSDTFDLSKGGNDIVHGGDGDDTFTLKGALTAADTIDGGAGISDALSLNGNYFVGRALTLGATTLQGVEVINFANGHSYDITTDDATVAADGALAVIAGELDSTHQLHFDGSNETDGSFSITGGAGDDVLIGGGQQDTFDLSRGGDDIAVGGARTDEFFMGGALNAGDAIDGGDGFDLMYLAGNYTAGVVFGENTLTNVDDLVASDGSRNYNITTANGTVGASQVLEMDGSAIDSSHTLRFDGSAELDGTFQIFDGAGSDTLTGGAQNDAFDLSHGGNDTVHGGGGNDSVDMGASFTAADAIDGGLGIDTMSLDGDYSAGNAVIFGATTMTGIDSLFLFGGHSYVLTTNNATVAAGAALTVNASLLGFGDSLTFNAVAETDGHFAITGGAGSDAFTLGSRAVLLASTIDGGSGNFDQLYLDGDFSTQTAIDNSMVANIDYLGLAAGHDYNFTAADGTTTVLGLQVEGEALGAGDDLTFDASADTTGAYLLYGGAGDDVLTGSQVTCDFGLSGGGADTITGGPAADTIFASDGLSADDTIDGGGGFNLIYLETAAVTNITFGVNSLANIDQITVAPHSSAVPTFTFTMNDANLTAGDSMTITGTALGATNTLTVNASAETNGHYTLVGGAAADTLTGGSQKDTLAGNGGNDVFKYTALGQSVSITYDHVTDFDAAHDVFDIFTAVGAVDTTQSGSVSSGSFDTDIAARTAGHFTSNGNAIVLHATGGTLNGSDFLVIDTSGDSAYTGSADLVIDITGFTGTIVAGDFI